MGKIDGSNKLIEIPIIKLKGFDFTSYLPRGSQKKIVEKMDTNKAKVSRVVNGHEYDEDIIKAIIDLIKELPRVKVPEHVFGKIYTSNGVRKSLSE